MINNMNLNKINPTKINLGEVQDTVEDTLKTARRIGRKSLLAYAGLLGMAYDMTTKEGVNWLAKAEKRGEKVEKDLMKQADVLRKEVEQRVTSVNGDVNGVVNKLQVGLQKFLKVNGVGEVTQEIEVITTETVKAMKSEAKTMTKSATATAKKAAQKATTTVTATLEASEEAVSEPVVQPFEGYDTLSWNQVIAKVETLDDEMLTKMRQFETTTRKRPSILKAIDAKLQAVAA